MSGRKLVGAGRPGHARKKHLQQDQRCLLSRKQLFGKFGGSAPLSEASDPGLLFGNPLLHLPDMEQSKLEFRLEVLHLEILLRFSADGESFWVAARCDERPFRADRHAFGVADEIETLRMFIHVVFFSSAPRDRQSAIDPRCRSGRGLLDDGAGLLGRSRPSEPHRVGRVDHRSSMPGEAA